jgi:hypothetical protein
VEKVTGGASAQKRSRPAGLDGGEIAGLEAGRRMPESENAAMNRDQIAAREPGPDLFRGDAGPQELSPGDNAVRPAGQQRQFSLDGARLLLHSNS